MDRIAKRNLREEWRLQARPARMFAKAAPVGLFALESDGYLYVPAGYRMEHPIPLILLLHGAGEDARDGLTQLREQADEAGLILLALSSCGPTWDLILGRGQYGPDIAAIDRALEHAFSRCAVDPARVAVGGYSDGAS
jgi:phospholipase/carboxylesterase